MLSLGFAHEWLASLDAVLSGAAEPWVICLALALTTLLVEDWALAAGAALAAHGTLSWPLAFAAVGGGIALGDVGLYALGLGARRVPWLHRRFFSAGEVPQGAPGGPGARIERLRAQLAGRLSSAVLLARVIPGLRLVTYTACGFLRVPLAAFTAWVALAVSLWTAGLFWLSSAVGRAISATLGVPVPLAVALPIILVAAAVPLMRMAGARWRGRTA